MASALSIIRPGNCALSAVAVVLGALVGAGAGLLAPAALTVLLTAALSAALVAGGGNALNDFFDAETDRTNHPERPIPSGGVSRDGALAAAVTLLAAGPLVAFLLLPCAAGLIAAAASLTLAAYETSLKRVGLPGNASIALLAALLFLFGGAAVSSMAPAASLALMAFFATLGREVVKDVQDLAGDTDRVTLPRRVGEARALDAAAAFTAIAVLLSPIPVFPLGTFPPLPYIPLVALADAALLHAAYVSMGDPDRGSSLYKYGMALALVAFLAGALV